MTLLAQVEAIAFHYTIAIVEDMHYQASLDYGGSEPIAVWRWLKPSVTLMCGCCLLMMAIIASKEISALQNRGAAMSTHPLSLVSIPHLVNLRRVAKPLRAIGVPFGHTARLPVAHRRGLWWGRRAGTEVVFGESETSEMSDSEFPNIAFESPETGEMPDFAQLMQQMRENGESEMRQP